jgi:acetyl esterase/lipase
MARIHADAPPFFLIHGEHDAIIPVDEARDFHAALQAVSRNPVVYSEVPRAGHAFDLVDSSHARRCAVEVGHFLNGVRDAHVGRRTPAAV